MEIKELRQTSFRLAKLEHAVSHHKNSRRPRTVASKSAQRIGRPSQSVRGSSNGSLH